MSEQPEQHEQREPVAPHPIEDDQTVPPRPEEELADAGRTDGHDS